MDSKRKFLGLCLILFSCWLYGHDVYQWSIGQEAAIIAPSLLLGSYSYLKSRNQSNLSLEELAHLSPTDVNKLDRFATRYYSETSANISDYLLWACLLAPLTLNLNPAIANEYKEANIIIAETYMLTSTLVYFSKVTFQRKRPLAYNYQVDLATKQEKDNQYSFFSGHTALAFSGAILTAKIYDDFHPEKDNTLIYIATATTASCVGYLRIKAGKHFPTDVIAGAIVGTTVALFISEIHKVDSSNSKARPTLFFQYNF